MYLFTYLKPCICKKMTGEIGAEMGD